MKKKLLCMGLAAVFAVSALAFAGCGGEEKTAELEKQLSAAQTTLQTQKEELDALKKENADLQKQIDGLNGKVDELEKFINTLGNKEAIGTFCDLSEAYEIGWLTKENIQYIVDHMFGQDEYPMEDKVTESKILHDYKLLDIKQSDELSVEYHGEYNGCYVIRIRDLKYDPVTDEVYKKEIAGIIFYDTQPFLRVWKPKKAA